MKLVGPAWYLLLLAGGGGAWLALRAVAHRAIRRGLAAPRVVETGDPGGVGLNFHCVSIPTANGRSLHGWQVPAMIDEQCQPAVVVVHGWGANAQMMLPLARPLHDAGFTVLFIDARCHGRSDDDSFASLPRFAEDAEHAFDWLAAQPGIDSGRIALLGHSVGAGAVLLCAARRPEVAAVVSVSAFAHPAEMMQRWLAGKPVPQWMGRYILDYVQTTIGHRFDDIAPLTSLGRLQCPVLLIHGEQDGTVPVEDARRLYAARAHEGVQMLTLPGDHESFADMAQEMRAVTGFLLKVQDESSRAVG
ncbi:MAG: alpha/beta fold hydrolase [Azoarcus sp.]|nr:alpha/beta fold hydrolase [Azoarcus sp.]